MRTASVLSAWSRASSPISLTKSGLYSTLLAPERRAQGMPAFSTISWEHSTWKSAGSEMNQRSRIREILSLIYLMLLT